jgi:hypothetical protein
VRIRQSAVVPILQLAALFVLAPAVRAQGVDSSLKGHVLPDVRAKRDSAYQYAAYIPRSYDGRGAAPLLLVLDPRGRAVSALERVVPAVERLGWVALSSYDTRGDASVAQNERIVNVMLADAFDALHLDARRIYVAAMSGTATDAWVFAFGSAGHIAGILSAESGMPYDTAWRAAHRGRPPFDVALAASRTSFGFDEVSAAARQLVADSAPIRLDAFPGAAGWPDDTALGQALDWLEARAMARGLRPLDPRFVDSAFAVDSGAAAALEIGHEPARAADAWAQIVAAWTGTHDVSYPRAREDSLVLRADVRRWRAERDSLVGRDSTERASLIATLIALRKRPGVPDLRRLTDDLRIVQFQTWAADGQDSVRAEWAQRRLSEIYTHASYYEPEAYLSVDDPARALAMLAIASEIRPRSPEVCRERARAYALRQDSDRTVAELRCALGGDAITVQEIRGDPRYRFLEDRDDFRALIGDENGS